MTFSHICRSNTINKRAQRIQETPAPTSGQMDKQAKFPRITVLSNKRIQEEIQVDQSLNINILYVGKFRTACLMGVNWNCRPLLFCL